MQLSLLNQSIQPQNVGIIAIEVFVYELIASGKFDIYSTPNTHRDREP